MATVFFEAMDEAGERCEVEVCRSMLEKSLPYLHTMVTTSVGGGAGDGPHEVRLPKGCTCRAFEALVHRAGMQHEDLQADWQTTGANAVSLLCTADFLLLHGLLPELAMHCRHVLKEASDVKQLVVLRMTHPDVQALVKEFRCGPLVETMTETQAIATATAMESTSGEGYALQAKVLVRWMRHADRSPEDIQSLTGKWKFTTFWTMRWSGNGYNAILKAGAAEFLTLLARLATERPQLFIAIVNGIYQRPHYDIKNDDLNEFGTCTFQIFCLATKMSDEMAKVLLDRAFQDRFMPGLRECLPGAFEDATDETKDTLLMHLVQSPQLADVVSEKLLRSLSVARRARVAAALMPLAGRCQAPVLSFIEGAIERGEL